MLGSPFDALQGAKVHRFRVGGVTTKCWYLQVFSGMSVIGVPTSSFTRRWIVLMVSSSLCLSPPEPIFLHLLKLYTLLFQIWSSDLHYVWFYHTWCVVCVLHTCFFCFFVTPKMGFDHLLSLLYHLQLITVELLINVGPLVSSYASLFSCSYSSCVLLSVANSFFSCCFPLTLHLPEAVTLLSMTKVVSLVPDLIMVNRATNCSIWQYPA